MLTFECELFLTLTKSCRSLIPTVESSDNPHQRTLTLTTIIRILNSVTNQLSDPPGNSLTLSVTVFICKIETTLAMNASLGFESVSPGRGNPGGKIPLKTEISQKEK